jgi:multisubunit Na+/H+ antiporter MnhG subunit
MSEDSEMNQRLGSIRALLERSPTYRAISARAALVIGILSVLVAVAVYLNNEGIVGLGRPIRAREFVVLWFIVFVISADATAFFLWRAARREERSFWSQELKLALSQLVPFAFIPAAFTSWFYSTGYLGARELELVVVWMASYGLALLATSLVAPISISRLGWAFLLTTVAVPAIMNLIDFDFSSDLPNLLLGFTFGFYHLVYAAVNWRRKPETVQ